MVQRQLTLDGPILVESASEHDQLGGSKALEVADGEDCGKRGKISDSFQKTKKRFQRNLPAEKPLLNSLS